MSEQYTREQLIAMQKPQEAHSNLIAPPVVLPPYVEPTVLYGAYTYPNANVERSFSRK